MSLFSRIGFKIGLGTVLNEWIRNVTWWEVGGGISHQDILLTFLDGAYLPTFSPVNMMMNNISWRAAECISPREGPGSLHFLPLSSSFFVTLFSLWVGMGRRRENEVDNHYRPTCISLRSTLVRDPALLLQHPPPHTPQKKRKHFHINNQAIFPTY